MKAKDTIMNPIKLSETIQYFPDWDLNRGNKFIEELCAYVAKAQAEISFPAGEKQGIEKGIRKVVEWIHENSIGCISRRDIDDYRTRSGVGLSFIGKDWQAKLKEWGIE